VHIVAPGETLSKISRLYGKSIGDIARANSIVPHATLKIGDRIIIPGMRTAGTAPRKELSKAAQPKPLSTPAAKAAAPAKQQVASAEPVQSANVVTPTAETPATGSGASVDAAPTFRRPVNGRVIAGFGPKTNGQQNDGVNFAVPEGTPIKAAEDGTVAYAGNELKGYGNLVLIRHSNGYVTAYAHAKELLVKRGEVIKRGQVIGKSGQTGNVDAPQLHFEVRKGPSPLDPMPLLNGG
jgi:murein DD-endopeptidase MepM/ murein hydrolase activator NlpD